MACPSCIDVGRTVTCCLEAGHSGPHQDTTGFPWEDHPQVYLSPVWVYRGAKLRKGENLLTITSVKLGRSCEDSSVCIRDVGTSEVTETPLATLLREYQPDHEFFPPR